MSEIVARGRIKVDATKAAEKLRDHLLVDLHLYAVEIARAAVALGAPELAVDWDSDDVTFTFRPKQPVPAAALARVRDHVLAPRDDDDGALRLLGIGVGAALGLGTSFVAIYVGGEVVTFRGPGEPEVAPSDASLEAGAIRVCVRRRMGLETLARVALRDAPREIELLVHASREAPLVVVKDGEPLGRAASAPVLVRVDLDEPSATRAVLEVTSGAGGGHVEWREQGLTLATYAGVAPWAIGSEPLPLRVVVDAKRLPTNASRSEIRADADLPSRVRARIPEAIAAAVDALRGAPRQGTAVLADAAALEDALGAIASHVAVAIDAGHHVPDELRAVTRLPLFSDVCGTPLALADLAWPAPVHDAPAPPELAPWLAGVVLRRGRSVERILAHKGSLPAADRVVRAQAAFDRKARALAKPPSRPVVPPEHDHILHVELAVNEGRFEGLTGEVRVARRDGAFRRAASARLFVDERLLEIAPLPAVGLPVDMALAWPGRIVARYDYDAVERTEELNQAVLYVLGVAAIAIGEKLGARDPELARLAVAAALGTAGNAVSLGALASAAIWPTTVPGRFASIDELVRYATRTRAICVAEANAGAAPDGRPVLVKGTEDAIRAFLPKGTAVIPYDRSLARFHTNAEESLKLESVRFPIKIGFQGGFLAPGTPKERVYHAGILLEDRSRASRNGTVTVIRDDPGAIPTLAFSGAHYLSPFGSLDREEDALVVAVVNAAERDEIELEPFLEYLEDSATAMEVRDRSAARPLVERIRALPERRARERRRRRFEEVRARPERDPRALPVPPGAAQATYADASGAATVALEPDAANWWGERRHGDVLLERHPLVTRALAALPIVSVVDVTDETRIDPESMDLTEVDADWAENLVARAAVELARTLVEAEGFPADAAAMRLVLALLEGWPAYGAHLAAGLAKVRWPTVQGPPIVLGGSPRTVPWANNAYAPYLTGERSPYDAPAVHAPEHPIGEARLRLLALQGHTLTDVTDAIDKLQRRRAKGRLEAPRLPGDPPHPILRASLQDLAVPDADGEVEVIAGPDSDVQRVDDRGVRVALRVAMPVPVRVVFRADAELDEPAVVDAIRGAAERLACRFAAELEALPTFARHALRAVMVKGLRFDADRALAVFPDTTGAFRSLGEIRALGTARYTTAPPPYPEMPAEAGPILAITEREARALEPFVKLSDITQLLARTLAGQIRRAAPPLARVELDESERVRCIHSFRIDADGITGEIGLLAPAHASMRGVHVHTTARPLCTLADGDGWPTIARIDVAGLGANEAFDGFGPPPEVARVRRAVHLAVGSHMSAFLEAPSGTLGIMRLPTPFVVRHGEVVAPCIGVFWVPPEWPERPEVHVEASGFTDPTFLPRASAGIVPVAGRLWIASDAVHAASLDVFAWVLGRLPAVFAAAMRSTRKTAPETLEAYRWELDLLGAGERDVTAELAKDRPDPVLVKVATRRAPHLLGEAPARAPEPAPAPPVPAPEPAPEAAPASESFFAGLVRRIREVLVPSPPVADTPLTRSLAGALAAMKLTGDPVVQVVEVRSGRPVRYVATEGRVVVNARHPSVRALAGDPSQVLFLLLAALSEINRELVSVTDAEEIQLLTDRLRDRG